MVDQSSTSMSRQKSGRRRNLLLGGRGGNNDQKKTGPSRRGSLFGALSRRVRRSSQTFTRTEREKASVETTTTATETTGSRLLPEEDVTITAHESSLESLTESQQKHHQTETRTQDPSVEAWNPTGPVVPSPGDAASTDDEEQEEDDEPFDAWLNNVLHDGHHVAAMCDTVDPDPELPAHQTKTDTTTQSELSLVQEFEKNRIRSFSNKNEPLDLDFSIIEETLARPDSMEFSTIDQNQSPGRKGAASQSRHHLLTRTTSSKRKNAKMEKYLSRDGSRRAVIAPAAAPVVTTSSTTTSAATSIPHRRDGHHGRRGSVAKATLQRDVTA